MPLEVVISAARHRFPAGMTKKNWRRALPQKWEDVRERSRRRYYEQLLGEGQAALPLIAREEIKLPKWAWQAMRPEEVAALAGALVWMLPKPDCGPEQPFAHFDHRGIRYHLPAPNGENLTCIEYPLAEEYLAKIYSPEENPDEYDPALLLTALLCREHDFKPERMRKRGDARVPVFGRDDVKARAEELKNLPLVYQLHALNWFLGLKQFVHKTYRNWLFEEPDDEEEEEDDDETVNRQPSTVNRSPDFGWWGIYQDVAEAGAFGTSVEEVLQAPFHDVCVWLVRQRVKAEASGGGSSGSSGGGGPQEEEEA